MLLLLLLLAEFLTSSAHYVTEAPLPQLWMQGSASEPAQVAQIPVPTEHAAWFDASEHTTHTHSDYTLAGPHYAPDSGVHLTPACTL
jgi:hypothetical protein